MKMNTNTLRLGQHELHKLLEQIEHNLKEVKHPDREFVRWPYRLNSIELVLEYTSGVKTTIHVATRNISHGGICILHCAYIHNDMACEVLLNLDGQKQQSVRGRVVRCTHVGGRVHEVGIQFEEQISTKNLLGLDPLNEAYSLERVEPSRLQGTVLTVTKTDIERDIMLMLLEDTQLVLNTADDVSSTLSLAKKGCDLILVDYYLGDESGTDLVRGLRETGSDIPVIIMTSSKSEATLDEIRDADASGILSKPITKDRLFQALAEFLHADGDGGPLYTTLPESASTFPLLVKFYADVKDVTHALEQALRDDDISVCMNSCRMLCGTASPLGFPTISALTIAAENKLVHTDNIQRSAPELRALIAACRRIKTDPATLKAIQRDEAQRIKDAQEMRPLY